MVPALGDMVGVSAADGVQLWQAHAIFAQQSQVVSAGILSCLQ